MSAFVLLPELLGLTASEAAGFAVGTATAFVLRPVVQVFENEAWALDPTKPLAAQIAAAVVAENVADYQWGENEAGNTGIDPERFKRLLGEVLSAPDLGTLYNLWRRNHITDADFQHGLRKAKLEDRWDDGLEALKAAKLGPAQIALGIVRTLFDSHGLLVGENDTTGGKIASTPVSKIDPRTEAEAWGIDPERLRVMVGEIGLPMALQEAANAVFRGIIEKPDFYLAVAQGDTRPAWADAIFEAARQIPSVADYVALHLRGHTDAAGMHDGAARHGMSPADADRIYLARGRPAAPGQMATAAARGIDGPNGTPMDRAQFLLGIAESDIRPEWGPMLWESRYLYPPLFQLTRLVQAGAIDAATAKDWATKDRYPPEVVNALHDYWTQGTVAKADAHVTKANATLWTTMQRSYINAESDAAALKPGFDHLGVPVPARTEILAALELTRELIRKQLTPAQVKKAYAKAVKNPATGVPWTRDDALAALIERGYTGADANTLLDS